VTIDVDGRTGRGRRATAGSRKLFSTAVKSLRGEARLAAGPMNNGRRNGLSPEECAVVRLIERRIRRAA